MIRKATSALYMPSLAERAQLRLQKLRVARTDETLRVAVKPFSPHLPHPKQRAFLELDAQEACFGGAAGSGKSDALLMSALQYVDRPTYSALLMRRHEVDLFKSKAIGDRAREWFAGTAAKWDAKLLGYRFPSYDSNPGATISFGHLTNETEKEQGKWKGPEFHFIGIEELTEWALGNYVFMFSRLRSTDPAIPTRMRSNTNPGGPGHEWVKDRFVTHARQVGTGRPYNEWRTGDRAGSPYFVSPPSSQVVELARRLGVVAQGSYFVPAFAADNLSLNQHEYRMNLALLDPTEFAWFAEGDWDAERSGEIFQRGWFVNYLDEAPPGLHWQRYWDLAGTDPNAPEAKTKDPAWTAGALEALQTDAAGNVRLIIADVRRDRLGPGDVDKFVLATAEEDGKGVDVVIEQEPGSAGGSVIFGYQRNTLLGWNVEGDHKTGSKEEMWRPLAGLAKTGGVWLVRGPWNAGFISELVGLPAGKKDQADCASGGYAWLLKKRGSRFRTDDIAVNPDEGARPSEWRSE